MNTASLGSAFGKPFRSTSLTRSAGVLRAIPVGGTGDVSRECGLVMPEIVLA